MKVVVEGVFDSEDLDFDFWYELVSRAEKLSTKTGDIKKVEVEYKWK